MAMIDISLITRLRNPRGREFLDKLAPGDSVGIHVAADDCYVMSNGRVAGKEDQSVFAELIHITQHPSQFRLLQDVNTGNTLDEGRPLRKGTLKRGKGIHVIETYANEQWSVMVSGIVTNLGGDFFDVGKLHFGYGATDLGGRRRKITVIGGY